jgi:hypothetical protein
METPYQLTDMKLRIVLFLPLLMAFADAAFAQEEKSDTLDRHYVMLIPYDPRYYLSDADRDIVEQTKKDARVIRDRFRKSVDQHVQRYISRSYPCISLLNDTADALEETMYYVLGHTGYKYEKAIPLTPKGQGNNDDFSKSKTKQRQSQNTDSKVATGYIPVEGDAMYMHAVVSKSKELFSELNEQYNADLFVFLTQFEIKTNYKECLDIANKIYRRSVMLHFSIYDKNGNLLAGSYATSYFPSDSNEMNTIIGECFPQIAEYIAEALP